MFIKRIIDQLLKKKSITEIEAKQVMCNALNGGATPTQITAFFTGMLMKGITRTELEGMLKGIKYQEVYNNKRNIDFYIYSFTQNNIVFSICFLLSQLDYLVCGKFKNLYNDNNEFFIDESTLDISSEQKALLLDKFQLLLYLSDYNKILKNFLFLKTELNFAKIFTILEMSINPIKNAKQIIFIDKKTFQQLQDINNFYNLFANMLMVIISSHEIKLLRVKKYRLSEEKAIKLHDLENYTLYPFSSAIRDIKFMTIVRIIAKEILKVFSLKSSILDNLTYITMEEMSKKILTSFNDLLTLRKRYSQYH